MDQSQDFAVLLTRRHGSETLVSRVYIMKTKEFHRMFDHIESRPKVLGGKPCIKGTRISVEFILEMMASGASRDDILRAYPHLSVEAIEDALRYASHFLKNDVVLTAEAGT